MGGYREIVNFAIEGMVARIQLIAEKLLNSGATELSWWQANRVHDENFNFRTVWTQIVVRRRNKSRLFYQPRSTINPNHCGL